MEFKQLSPLLHPKPNNWLRLERRRIYILSIYICSAKILFLAIAESLSFSVFIMPFL